MISPYSLFTEDGHLEHVAHVVNMRKAIFWFINNEDDLELEDDDMDILYKMREWVDNDRVLVGDPQ